MRSRDPPTSGLGPTIAARVSSSQPPLALAWHTTRRRRPRLTRRASPKQSSARSWPEDEWDRRRLVADAASHECVPPSHVRCERGPGLAAHRSAPCCGRKHGAHEGLDDVR